MRNQSVSITGATGFIGWHLTDTFVRHEWAVRAIVRRGNTKRVPVRASVAEADLTVDSLFDASGQPDVFIHCAGVTRTDDEAEFLTVNVEGTRAAAEAARRAGSRFIFISSLAAAGPGTPAAPRREDDEPAPVNSYGRSKLAAEEAVRSVNGLAWTILRPGPVYGPRDRGFLPLFKMARRGFLVGATRPDMAFSLMYIGDLLEAVRQTAESSQAAGQTMFLAHPRPRTTLDLLHALAMPSGRSFHPLWLPAPVVSAAASIGDYSWRFKKKPLIDSARLAELRAPGFVCSVERLRQITGFEAETELEDGIARTTRWYSDERWI
jgi:nucleoside-diphosphate-sugar epimerase